MTTSAGRPLRAERPPRRPTAPDGLVVVDKPQGWTSHDVVGRMRRLAGTKKVGHAGTLDPMATGVLVVGVGRATRLLTYVVGAEKEYVTTVRLGVATTTEDAEGEVTATTDAGAVTADAVRAAAATLTGDVLQVPSAVSAIKVDGERAYARVRAGEQVELAARPVTISAFEIEDVRPGPDVPTGGGAVHTVDVDARVVCSSGTYVRALGRDLGAALGVGAHLVALRRTRVGGYDLAGARTLEQLEAQADADGVLATLPLADAARATFPVRELDDDDAAALGHGRALPAAGEPGVHAAIGPDGTLVALVEDSKGKGGLLARPAVVFAAAG
ncbi:tRNA pseudouridine(55) synthase TruB [Luteimicrobium xylanilyticum]|uniref:tRNA pseudouridine synthase B n=1 Tax=Luteimicrobium xylanilyticum TaxID=1133546 RepID=A0A5P9Q925_9MICO|nr:tRNA pseudouridine(55) synthase TruB [Luteimicrobium xylanilyticum]QFU97924.1 tRNA pseudouridine(55) synthase [Luteimicrobium xylanilyticum]